MKEKVVKSLQRALEKVSLNSVGKSIPVTMYEREIPKAVLKKCKENSGEKNSSIKE